MTARPLLSSDDWVARQAAHNPSLDVRSLALELQQARAALRLVLDYPIPPRWAKQQARACLPAEDDAGSGVGVRG